MTIKIQWKVFYYNLGWDNSYAKPQGVFAPCTTIAQEDYDWCGHFIDLYHVSVVSQKPQLVLEQTVEFYSWRQ